MVIKLQIYDQNCLQMSHLAETQNSSTPEFLGKGYTYLCAVVPVEPGLPLELSDPPNHKDRGRGLRGNLLPLVGVVTNHVLTIVYPGRHEI